VGPLSNPPGTPGQGYGLPKPMVKRALIEVYQTVVLDQQRYRDHS
jgi:hypothetical protein